MRRLLFVLGMLCLAAPLYAQICTDPQVQAAINAASNGGTVTLTTPCNTTWASQVTIPSTIGITLNGNGATISGGISLTQNATTSTRITGFTFTNQANCTSSTPITTNANSSTPFADAPFRLDHNTFSNSALSVMMCINGIVRGLIDHNTVSGGNSSELIHLIGIGGSTWPFDVVPGSGNAVFIEDNTFSSMGGGSNFVMAEEAFTGSVFVFRHNTMNGACNDVHDGTNGGRWWEIYDNTYNETISNPYCFMDLRGGTGIVFGNTSVNASGQTIRLGPLCQGGSDTCSGSYRVQFQVGAGINGTTYSPAYLWGNDSVIQPSINVCSPAGCGSFASTIVAMGSAPTDATNCTIHTAPNTNVCDAVKVPPPSNQPTTLERCESAADVAAGCPVSYAYTSFTYPHPLQNQPTLVQHVSTSMEGADSSTLSASSLSLNLPNAALANNLLIVAVQESNANSAGVSIADDKSLTWNAGPTRTGTNQLVSLFYAFTGTGGTQKITATFSSSATCNPPGGGMALQCVTRPQMVASEFYNVISNAPVDGTASASATPAANCCGTITTTVDGDLIYQYGVEATNVGSLTLGISGFTAGSSFNLLSADRTFGAVAQYQIQGTHGAISPSFTISGNSDIYDTVAIAFKAGSAGTAPAAGIRIVHVQHMFQPRPTPGNDPDIVANFPSQGNLIVALNASGRDVMLNTSTDTNSNTYTPYCFGGTSNSQCAGQSTSNQGATIIYAANATTSTSMVVTLKMQNTTGGSTGHNMLVFYDVTGAATSPHDVDAGTQSTTSSCGAPLTFATVTITPTNANELVFATVPVFQSTVNGTTGTPVSDVVVNPLLDQGNTCGGANTNPSNLDEDNGFAHYYNGSNTSAVTFTFFHSISSVGHWTAVASAFMAPMNVVCTPAKVVFKTQPQNAGLGASIGTLTLSVQDANSNDCSSNTSNIVLSLHANTCTGMQLNGTTSGSNVFTTNNVNITNATGNCQLDATDGVLTGATSNVFTITGDTTPPLPGGVGLTNCTGGGNPILTASNIGPNSLVLNWIKACDPDNTTATLLYEACYSIFNNISTPTTCEQNGTLFLFFTTDIATVTAINLALETTYYFNVIVRDPAGNKAAYHTLQQATASAGRRMRTR